MNEFLEQFLIEAHELVQQGTADLLALEADPRESGALDGAFRAFHTLKGGAGIMEFEPMARTLHAAEDVLGAARAGAIEVTAVVISDCLTCLDQVVQWLDVIERTGAMPADAEAIAEALVRRVAPRSAPPPPPQSAPPEIADADWVDALLEQHPEAAARATLAVRYVPAADSFFADLDPLEHFRSAEGLLALGIAPARPWPSLAAFDPFEAQVVLTALLQDPPAEWIGRLATLGEQVATVPLSRPGPAGNPLADPARALLQAQVLMLAAAGSDGQRGRIRSAGRVAASVLHRTGQREAAERFARIARTADRAATLVEALEILIAGGSELIEPGPRLETQPAAGQPDLGARSLRVDVQRIDALVNLTGELVVAKNALAHVASLASAGGDVAAVAEALKTQQAELDRLVGALQHAVLNVRVLPLRQVFQRFPRLVREMALALGKPARLVTEGETTEADKVIVESLFEPLLHVLRNALDHGVEKPEARAAAGKPPEATIALRARREADRVLVEVEDDGAGIDVGRVREIGIARGLVTAAEAADMTNDEITNLIFAPGFSTARAVTELSGRGVGMDAVRSSIERLSGRVSVTSRPGAGTRMSFSLPFTVMMTRVMTFEAAGQLFGIPLDGVLETVRAPRERILPIGAAHAIALRGRTVPVLDLSHLLGRGELARGSGEANLVVAGAGGRISAFEVDRLGDRLDVMLKPLDGLLAATPGVAGATLLGDGRVLLVLDLLELLE